jgi:hypothetical protein
MDPNRSENGQSLNEYGKGSRVDDQGVYHPSGESSDNSSTLNGRKYVYTGKGGGRGGMSGWEPEDKQDSEHERRMRDDYKYRMIHRGESLNEATSNNNAGNLLIGQTVDILVTDAGGNKFLRQMQVGEHYPANTVLMRDIDTQDTVVLVFDQDESNKLKDGLVYLNIDQITGVTYKLVISSNLLSNQSITSQFLIESQRISETNKSSILSKIVTDLVRSGKKVYLTDESTIETKSRDDMEDVTTALSKAGLKFKVDTTSKMPAVIVEFQQSVKSTRIVESIQLKQRIKANV